VTNRYALVGVFAPLRRSRGAILLHPSVAIKQGEICSGGRKFAFSISKHFPNAAMAHKLVSLRMNEYASFYCCMLEMFGEIRWTIGL